MSNNNDTKESQGLSRRPFLQAAGAATLTLGIGASVLGGRSSLAAAAQKDAGPKGVSSDKPYNILFILTDQERYFRPGELPSGYSLPGRERLEREGVTFANHQINSAVCTSSRSVIYTGQHIQHTGMFDNTNAPWQGDMSREIPTIGDRMRELGCYAAYLGKWHLSDAFEEIERKEVPYANLLKLNQLMNDYGFSDYFGVGDIIASTMGGYRHDEFITSTAIRWLRAKAQPINAEGQPWYLAFNLVNPHDVMYYDTDELGESVQKTPRPLMNINRDPANALYRSQWGVKLPASRREPWKKPGRPKAHYQYQTARQALVGQFPNQDKRWRRLNNYYLNCISDCDHHVVRVLDELDALGLTENTIVVMTADHGELGGAHGMYGKGATAYREQNHVPLRIRHPSRDVPRGTECHAVTSPADLMPTLLSLASRGRYKPGPELKGVDFSSLLKAPAEAKADAVRDAALYCFNMWLYQDADYMAAIAEILRAGGGPEQIQAKGLKIDMTKRGAIRSIFDGRYRFARYFAPVQHNLPRTIDELLALNDVELYDVEKDPHEMNNLAANPKASADLLDAMNAKLNAHIDAEVGEDVGQMLPGKTDWVATTFDP